MKNKNYLMATDTVAKYVDSSSKNQTIGNSFNQINDSVVPTNLDGIIGSISGKIVLNPPVSVSEILPGTLVEHTSSIITSPASEAVQFLGDLGFLN